MRKGFGEQAVSLCAQCAERVRLTMVVSVAAETGAKLLPDCHRQMFSI
jgi:hypothetical protein